MRNILKSSVRRAIYFGMVALITACSAVGVGSSTVQQGILQLDNGVVKVQNPNGNLEPVAGDSTFELVGTLDSMDPWQVSGRALQRNESTQIAKDLNVGDQVRVRGAVLEDGSWLAYSIESAQEQTDQNKTITMIGKVDSVNPWVVNGITLNVTNDTVVNGEITPGTLVQVEVLLEDDGTWEVVNIAPLGNLTPTSGCANVVATVASVNGNQVQFLGWPTPVTVGNSTPAGPTSTATDNNGDDDDNDDDENGVDVGTLQPGQQVLAVVCVGENNQLVITKLTLLNGETDEDNDAGQQKVLICHKPAKKGGHTISVASPAVPAHLGHGDKLGACP